MKQAVLWDMDGTLIDSERIYNACCAAYCKEKGYPFVDASFFHRYEGTSQQETNRRMQEDFSRLKVDLDPLEVERQRVLRYLSFIRRHGVPVFPGAYRVMGALGAWGIRQALCTSSHKEDAFLSLSLAGLFPKLSCVLYAQDAAVPKPSPCVYLLAARRLGVSPQDCLVVEDSASGMEAALAAGMDLALKQNEVKAPGSVKRFSTLDEILQFVKE